MPAQPFRAMLKRRLRELELLSDRPYADLANDVGMHERAIRRILDGQEEMAFSTADLITTRLEGPMSWHERPSLRQIYKAANLRKIDWAFPVSEKVRLRFARRVRELHERFGTYGLVAEHLGISESAVNRYALMEEE